MKRFPYLFLILCVFLLSAKALPAQKGSISGTVLDQKTEEKLPGARIELREVGAKKAKLGAIANKEGAFKIRNITPGKYVLISHFVGYKNYTKDIVVKEGEDIVSNIELIPDVIGLNEVVVTGVASRNEKAVSDVSVARIDASELQERAVYQDVSQVLAGKVSGVQVQTSSGNVGGGIRFQVRGGGGLNGDGQPVIFVDGARINNDEIGIDIGGQAGTTLADINPEDIASIEVLKGPAGAALYGTSGSNGVILITTKSGKATQDFFSVNYKNVMGWNEQSVEYDEADFYSAADANNIFRDGPLSEQTLSFQGKSGMFSYYGSYTDRTEDGIVGQNSFDRQSVRGNFQVFPNKQVKIKLSGNYITTSNSRPINDNNVTGWLGNVLLFPTSYLFTDSLAIANIDNTIATNRFIGSAEINYMPDWMEGLQFRGLIGFDGLDYVNTSFLSPEYFYTGPSDNGEKELFSRTREQLNYDLNVSYNYQLTDEIFATSILGAQMFTNTTSFADFIMQGYTTPRIRNMEAAADFNYADDGRSDYREAGIYFQEDINFSETYFLNLAVRNDYSSVIGDEAPSIFYPKISGAVRIDKLGVLPEDLNFLKLRGGWGQSGQLPGALAAYPLRWAGSQSGFGVGGVLNSIGNPEIVPERINEIEFGIEAEYMDAYGIDFTYYMQFAKESIIPFPNAPSSGLTASTVPKNVGEIKSWGFETILYATPIMTKEYELGFNIILNQQDNEVVDLGGSQPVVGGFGNQGWYEGYSRSAFFERKVYGALFDEETGAYAGPDASDELEFLGTPVPTFNGSFSTNFRFLEHFTLYVMFEFATGHSIYNNTRAFQVSFGNDIEYTDLQNQLFGNPDEGIEALKPNTPEYIETANAYAKLNPNYDANFIEEGNWLRLREISLRVNATDWLEMLFGDNYVKSFTFVASVRNLALWSTYSGVDPEVNMFGSRTAVARSVDFLTLQNPRVWNFTFNLGL